MKVDFYQLDALLNRTNKKLDGIYKYIFSVIITNFKFIIDKNKRN